MNHLQLHFLFRAKALSFPVDEQEFARAREVFLDLIDEPTFIKFETVHGQIVWLNAARLQIVRFLFEPLFSLAFPRSELAASTQEKFSHGEDVNLEDARWRILVWLTGREDPIHIDDVSGHDWITLMTSIEGDPIFFVITDGDGEDVAIRVDDVDLIVGCETNRYTEDHMDAVHDEVKDEQTA